MAGGRSKPRLVVTVWDRDPELTSFVLSRLGLLSQLEIHARAVERFGASRVPSKSAVNRFAMREEQRSRALVQQQRTRDGSGKGRGEEGAGEA